MFQRQFADPLDRVVGRKAVCISSIASMPAYFMSAKICGKMGVMSYFGCLAA